jgi:hypothetical protein
MGGQKLCEIMPGHHSWVSKKKRTQKQPKENEIERFETVIRCINCGYEQMTIESTGYLEDDECK